MNSQYKDPAVELESWKAKNIQDILDAEKEFDFEAFSHEDAREAAERMVEIVKQEGYKPVGVRVVLDGLLLYQYLMDGKEEDGWLDRKERTVEKLGHASLYGRLLQDEYPEMAADTQYALSGGGFPLIIHGKIRGFIGVSGLHQDEDHALLMRALSEMKQAHSKG